jgi:hypothetical protein
MRKEKMMYTKGLGFAILSATLFLPVSSYSQGRGDINATNESIVIISEEPTPIPGYVHTQYAFVDQDCGPMMVDRYGPPVDPRDPALKQDEQRMCLGIAPGRPDAE